MATTEHLRVKPDFFSTEEECKTTMKIYKQSNPRYSNFVQSRFHAGDENQFEQYRSLENGQVCIPDIDLSKNVFESINLSANIDWIKYKNLNANTVLNTFRYIFHKFKKGIYVKIRNNKLEVFLPFSKAKFVNEWGERIKVDKKMYRNISDMIKHIYQMEGRNFNPKKVNKFTNTWWGNNCILRYEFPPSENDSGVGSLADMFIELCNNREIPDMEFFLNKRDFPILKKDGTEPYEHIFDRGDQPLLSHNYPKYTPILSMTTTSKNADVSIPTWEDWARVSPGKFFPKSCRSYHLMFDTPWNKKFPIAVFRGASTGCGVNLNTNMRLKVSYLSKITPQDKDLLPLLDAGITSWNLRPRKIRGQDYLQTIEIKELPFQLVNPLTPEEQSKYKYIINIDGHSSAYRLSLELKMRSVILLVDSKYKLWYRDMLIPNVHYIPVKGDLSDLIEKIRWCKTHDDECKKIAKNARKFYDTFLAKNAIFDYLQKALIKLKENNGIYLYNYISPFKLQIRREIETLKRLRKSPETTSTLEDISSLPYMNRCYGLLNGIEWVVNKVVTTTDEVYRYIIPGEEIAHTKTSIVRSHSLGVQTPDIFAVKSYIDREKILEATHEEFVGKTCINQVLNYIPNFAYTFASYTEKDIVHLITERIYGQRFDLYLQEQKFSMKDYLWILIQICLSLQVAQNSCGFVHYDTYPWNIIIQRLPQSLTLDYIVAPKQVIRIKTNILPILIDYGKSHVIVENQHYGFVQLYKTSTIQDVLSILLKSIYQIIVKKQLNRGEIRDMILLSNFVTKTKFRHEEFKDLRSLKTFLHTVCKYECMIFDNKYELEQLAPIDLVTYIQSHFGKFPIEEVNEFYYSSMNRNNGKQVFDYILSPKIEGKLLSYKNVFIGLKHCTLPQPKNLFFTYYAAQNIYHNILTVYEDMKRFLRHNNIPEKEYENMFKDCRKYLISVYENMFSTLPKNQIKFKLGKYELKESPYDTNTFSNPQDILKLLEDSKDPGPNLSEYQNMIALTLFYKGEFSLNKEDRKFYTDNLKDLLKVSPIVMMDSVANVITLRETAYNTITTNLVYLSDKLETATGDCTEAERLVGLYERCLEILEK